MTEHVWILVRDDTTVEAYEHRDDALNAARDEENPWIELVPITPHATERPVARSHTDETHADAAQPGPSRETGSHRRSWIAPPSLTIRGAWVQPWDGGDAA